MSYLSSITRLYKEGNLSGIVCLQVARKADVVSVPNPVGRTVYGVITLKEGAGFIPWDVTLESPRNSSTEQNTREGSSKRKRLQFTIAKDREDLRYMLEQAEQDEFIIVFTDGNGKQKLLGTPWAPMRFSFAHDSGSQFTDLNGYECQFYYEGPDNEYFYPATIAAPPTGPQPVVIKFGRTTETAVAILTAQPGEEVIILSDYSFSQYFTVAP